MAHLPAAWSSRRRTRLNDRDPPLTTAEPVLGRGGHFRELTRPGRDSHLYSTYLTKRLKFVGPRTGDPRGPYCGPNTFDRTDFAQRF